MNRRAVTRTQTAVIVIVIVVAAVGGSLTFLSSRPTPAPVLPSQSIASISSTGPAKLVFGTSFAISGYHEVPLVAIDKEYFAKEGLDVSYVPTGGSSDLLSKMIAGQIDIGWLGSSTTILAIENQAVPLEFIGMGFQKSPLAIFAATGQDITSPKDLRGKTLAAVAGAEEALLFPAYLKCEDIDPSSVHLTYVAPNVLNSMVTQSPILTFENYLSVVEQFAKAAGKNITANFRYTDCLKGLYGNGFVVFKKLVQTKPDVLHRFMIGIGKSFEFAYLYPMQAAEIGAKYYPALGGSALANNEENIRIFTSQLALSDDVQAHGWNWMTEGNWNTTITLINKYMTPVKTVVKPSDIFTNDFNPGIKPTDTNVLSYSNSGIYSVTAEGMPISRLTNTVTVDFPSAAPYKSDQPLQPLQLLRRS